MCVFKCLQQGQVARQAFGPKLLSLRNYSSITQSISHTLSLSLSLFFIFFFSSSSSSSSSFSAVHMLFVCLSTQPVTRADFFSVSLCLSVSVCLCLSVSLLLLLLLLLSTDSARDASVLQVPKSPVMLTAISCCCFLTSEALCIDEDHASLARSHI